MHKLPKFIQYTISLLGLLLFVGVIYLFLNFFDFGPGDQDYTYKIAGSCNLTRTSAHVVAVGCGGYGVPPEVVQVGWNDNYLLAVTNPIKDYPNSYSNPDPTVKNWWIVDLKSKLAYGPFMSEDEFNKKKSDLGIGNIELWPIDQAKTKGIKVK